MAHWFVANFGFSAAPDRGLYPGGLRHPGQALDLIISQFVGRNSDHDDRSAPVSRKSVDGGSRFGR